MALTIDSQEQGPVVVVTPVGDIDVSSAPTLGDGLDRLIASGRVHLVVDLHDVSFIDSTGLGVLVGRLKLTRLHRGSMRLVCTSARLLRLFGITGIDKVFTVHESSDEAVEATTAHVLGGVAAPAD